MVSHVENGIPGGYFPFVPFLERKTIQHKIRNCIWVEKGPLKTFEKKDVSHTRGCSKELTLTPNAHTHTHAHVGNDKTRRCAHVFDCVYAAVRRAERRHQWWWGPAGADFPISEMCVPSVLEKQTVCGPPLSLSRSPLGNA